MFHKLMEVSSKYAFGLRFWFYGWLLIYVLGAIIGLRLHGFWVVPIIIIAAIFTFQVLWMLLLASLLVMVLKITSLASFTAGFASFVISAYMVFNVASALTNGVPLAQALALSPIVAVTVGVAVLVLVFTPTRETFVISLKALFFL